MKVSIGIGGAASGQRRDFDQWWNTSSKQKKLGVDTVWTAEAWGQDAIAPLAYRPRAQAGSGSARASCRSARECPR